MMMTEKRERFIVIDEGLDFMVRDTVTGDDLIDADGVCDVLNDYEKENEQLKQDIRELQNDKLLTELQMKCDKKQEHIVVLENKIRRMREAIHKLEWLSGHRNADLIRENEQLKQSIKEIDDAELHLKQIILKRIDDYIWQWEDEGTPVAQVLKELKEEIE